MSTKKPTAAERLASLTKGAGKSTPIAKVKGGTENARKDKRTGKHVSRDIGKGGAREGAGGPPRGDRQQKRALKQMIADFAGEEVPVTARDPLNGEMVTIKKPRVMVMVQKLYEIGVKGEGDSQAIERGLNRMLGKPVQPVVGDEDEDAIQVDTHGVDRMLDKAYGNEDGE